MTITPTDPATASAGPAPEQPTTTVARTCPLCEAGCGLSITVRDGAVTRIRGDRDDVFSHGYLCPKGSTLKQLHDDPDRLRQPMIRRGNRFEPATWEEAWQAVADGLGAVIDTHGRGSLAAYLGNPNAHNLGALLYNRVLLKTLGSPHVYSASTVDQRPKEISSGLMFGNALTNPVPDIDRTDHLVILGANPYASNGSFATAPDWPGRIEALTGRGGRLVVIDPRRTRTAEAATEYVPILPGTDPYLLAAMLQVLCAEDLIDLGTVAPYVSRLDELAEAVAPFTPEIVASRTGIDADTIRRLARDLAAADSAAVYARIGTTVSPFGTVTSWLVDALNICTGNLDRPGGAMFTTAAAGASNTRGAPRYGRGIRLGRRRSRVRGLPETFGELPAVCMAEEIETPGEGQIRAMITVAGNPVLSTPDSGRLDAALGTLEFMVAIDIYINETTRHADVILPAPSALQKSHYDVALLQLAIRNVANYSPPVLPVDDGAPDEWEILSRLAMILQGAGPDADPAVADELTITSMVESAVADEHGPLHGRDPSELLGMLAPRVGPERILDFMLRSGPYGDGFGRVPDGLSLDALVDHPHGIDLGPLQPRMPDGAAHPRRHDRPRPRDPGRRRRRPAPRRPRRPRGRTGADRPPPPAFEQLLDAQHRGPGEGQAPLHPPGPSRRCPRSRPRRRGTGRDPVPVRRRRRPGGGHRCGHARGREPAPRLGPRRRRSPALGGGRARRRQLERPGRHRGLRSHLRHRGAQRDPRRGQPCVRPASGAPASSRHDCGEAAGPEHGIPVEVSPAG